MEESKFETGFKLLDELIIYARVQDSLNPSTAPNGTPDCEGFLTFHLKQLKNVFLEAVNEASTEETCECTEKFKTAMQTIYERIK